MSLSNQVIYHLSSLRRSLRRCGHLYRVMVWPDSPTQFDKRATEVLGEHKAKCSVKAKLHVYRLCDEVWTSDILSQVMLTVPCCDRSGLSLSEMQCSRWTTATLSVPLLRSRSWLRRAQMSDERMFGDSYVQNSTI